MHRTSRDIHVSHESITNIWNALAAMKREMVADHYHALGSGDWSGFDEGENEIIETAVEAVRHLYTHEMPRDVCIKVAELVAISDAIDIGNDWLCEGGELSADDGQFYEQLTQVKKDISEILSAHTINLSTQIPRPRV